MILQEIAESIGGSVILADRGERLSDEECDVRSFAVGLSQGLLRCLQRLIVLLLMIIGLGESPLGLPAGGLQLQGFLEGRDGGFVFALVGEGHAECREGARVVGIELRGFFEHCLRLRPIVLTEVQHSLQEQDVRVPGSQLQGLAHVLSRLRKFVGVDGLQAFVEGVLGLGSKDRLTGNAHVLVGRVFALEINIDLCFEGNGQREILLRSLISGRFYEQSEVSYGAGYEECSPVGGCALIRWDSIVVQLYGGGGGNRLPGAVADRDRNFKAITAEHSSVSGAVLAKHGKRRDDEAKNYRS